MQNRRALICRSALLILAAAGLSFGLTGCESTSISNNSSTSQGFGYRRVGGYQKANELREADVLGVRPGDQISDADISRALDRSSSNQRPVPRGSRVLLVQSGAAQPDAHLREAMEAHFAVVPASGIPNNAKGDPEVARRLRMTAAQMGASHVIVVWGKMSTSTSDLPTKTVSWVPLAGSVFPDEHKATRIEVRAVTIDTRNDHRSSVSAPAFSQGQISSRMGRGGAWDRHLETLKRKAYPALAAAVSGG